MKKIFLVDDDPIFVFLLQRMIKTIDESMDILIFSDGEMAMNELDLRSGRGEQLPDIIFLDLNMPVMDGWQFLESYASAYRAIGKRIAIYIVSSTISSSDIKKAGEYPFVWDLIIKPVEKDQLKQALWNDQTQ